MSGLHFCLLFSMCATAQPESASPTDETSDEPKLFPNGDTYCGPRSVRYVLEYYGISDDFACLVREIQSPDTEMGSTFGSMKIALRKRGISAELVSFAKDSRLHWDFPVIV